MNANPSKAIQKVKLEFLRPGPPHNQLLSPLTPYIALCGEDGPVTVQMPFEHRQLLMRLRRLRYDSDKNPAQDEQRQAEVRDMGEAIGRVFSQVPALLSELGSVFGEAGKLVHLSLSLSAFELGLIPFELAVGMDGFPGSGSPLFLQTRMPITITREVRRGSPLPIKWDRPVRILFAFAEPEGLNVPAQAHLNALRMAIEPWVKVRNPGQSKERVQDVKKILTVLPNASLKQIREACASTEYTHVHILAHGAPLENSGDKRYGVALCNELDGSKDIVDGERLAIALTARDASGKMKFCPTMVTLATCDSGNIESVLTPGGSIAHELHAAGIPWVIASQFPLWMRASAIAAEVLYHRLLNGADPRWVIYELRQRLRTESFGTHDWASIVAYATVPADFEQQVDAFRDKQIRAKFEIKFDRIDELVGANEDIETTALAPIACGGEVQSLCKSIRADLKAWREEPEAVVSSKIKSERLGMSAASEKRIGIAYSLFADSQSDDSSKNKNREESKKAYEASREFYREALETEPHNYWVITQYLSITATPALADEPAFKALSKNYGLWWGAARQITEWQMRQSTGESRAWSLATLAELALLGIAYGGAGYSQKQAKEEITRYCKEMRALMGPDAFPIFSTRRQFRRYIRHWPRDQWNEIPQAALQALGNNSMEEK
ncbi:CHAT domain-containing protein [Methylomicrobium sp. Wu6]|uniref:CHAT domain-containing protein n=1 Tax=Methylomicrobium sp. Wu6 TaxID=3107928 RepID=UPI002DD6B857|nr:CHAT domain-containing protein [Methylomicrobium sp. Wu6]MEC4748877.1 CHAT domain-containing protein [Methylomicrobium sp. Wu6]